MKNLLKSLAIPMAIVLCGVLGTTLVATQEITGGARLVDFRVGPLEQAKKISLQVREREGSGEVLTVMNRLDGGEGRHMIVGRRSSTPPELRSTLHSGNFDSLTWSRPPTRPRPAATCDSQQECVDATDDMCENAGHDGVDTTTVTITVHIDGSRTCSGDCNSNGAVAFVTCS